MLGGDSLGGELVASEAKHAGWRPDPREPGPLDRLGEITALGEEAVAGMDGVGARLLRGAHVLGRVEVRGDLDDRVGGAGVERAAVVRRDDGGCLDPQPAAGAEDAQRDLATVRHEHPPERHRR